MTTRSRSFILMGFASLLVTQILAHIQGSSAITLERTSCFGTCPAYRVQLDGAGKVTFTGLNRWADAAGTASVATSAVQQLFSEFEHLRFFALDTAYVPGSPKCGGVVTDHAWLTLTVVGSHTKSVRYYTGCLGSHPTTEDSMFAALHNPAGEPGVLSRLAKMVDSVAGTRRWLRSRSR